MAAKYNLTPTNILQALVSHDMETSKAVDNPGKAGALVSGYNSTEAFSVDMGQSFYEEGEEELLDACFDSVAMVGDLSPRHVRSRSNKGKKTHERQYSWDSKVTQEVVIRQLPMRVAKQKRAAPTTSARSNRSKKK